ncbi:telomere-protecting terminal protein Tpg [Streptomyces sp. NPDC005506]|uniref:telomere-protecting terminal protein Tpg n=1 Tax=unclassified Streptomyces TaxID=2593676 RepID=UPI0036CF6D2B
MEETESEWQPQVRAQARERAATSGGMHVECTAYFGFTANGSSDDGRERFISTPTAPTYAAQILHLQEQGATDDDLHPIVAEAITESYFTEWGTRAAGLRRFHPRVISRYPILNTLNSQPAIKLDFRRFRGVTLASMAVGVWVLRSWRRS